MNKNKSIITIWTTIFVLILVYQIIKTFQCYHSDPGYGLAVMFCPVNLFIPYLAPFFLISLFIASIVKVVKVFKSDMKSSQKIFNAIAYLIVIGLLTPVIYMVIMSLIKTGGQF